MPSAPTLTLHAAVTTQAVTRLTQNAAMTAARSLLRRYTASQRCARQLLKLDAESSARPPLRPPLPSIPFVELSISSQKVADLCLRPLLEHVRPLFGHFSFFSFLRLSSRADDLNPYHQ